jgi:hypothetical protein
LPDIDARTSVHCRWDGSADEEEDGAMRMGDQVVYSMRMPPSLCRELDAFAARTGRNRSQATRDLVSLALKRGLGKVLELPAEEQRRAVR